jgi:hypothetical protein
MLDRGVDRDEANGADPTLKQRFAEPPAPGPRRQETFRLAQAGTRTVVRHESELGFRQFLLRGPDNVCGDWILVTMAWNRKQMFALAGAN